MSDTPRTDAASRHREGLGLESGKVCSDFARELERELVAAQVELAALKAEPDPIAEITRLREDLSLAWYANGTLRAELAALKAHDPIADRDCELRKDLICAIWPEMLRIYDNTDPKGNNWDLVRINARAQALQDADAMIAAMKKGQP